MNMKILTKKGNENENNNRKKEELILPYYRTHTSAKHRRRPTNCLHSQDRSLHPPYKFLSMLLHWSHCLEPFWWSSIHCIFRNSSSSSLSHNLSLDNFHNKNWKSIWIKTLQSLFFWSLFLELIRAWIPTS